MVTENSSSSGFQTWKQSHLLNRNTSNSKNGFVMGISDDIERSRSFARTLRQSRENRWWTAKYNNAPRFTGSLSNSNLQSSRMFQSAPDLMYQEYLEQGLTRSSRTMSLCLRKNSVARRNLARTNSVAQSDLGVSYRDRGDYCQDPQYQEIVQSGASHHVRDMIRPNNPVSVKTIELRQRENKDKVKIRYPFSRSKSRPKLKHKINLQMEKNEAEVNADRGES